MVCEGKRKITMSGVNAINSSNVSFSGKKNAEETKKSSKPKQTFTSKVANKLAQPVKDSFHKKYGEDAKPTPKLVGDYIVDTALKVAVPVATAVVLFTKMRKNTNGLTEAFKRNMGEVSKEANMPVKEKFTKVIKDSLAQVKKNNAEKLAQTVTDTAQEAGEQVSKKGIFARVAEKLREAASVKTNGKFDSNKATDVAISGLITAGASTGAINITEDVVTSDDKDLAEGEQPTEPKIVIKDKRMKNFADQAGKVIDILSAMEAAS